MPVRVLKFEAQGGKREPLGETSKKKSPNSKGV